VDSVGSVGDADVVLGVDLGTTSTKVVAFDCEGRSWGSQAVEYPLTEPEPGQAVQDPDAIRDAVANAVRQVAAEARSAGASVCGLSFSAAMHSLIGLDAGGRPLTPSVTWADTRAAEQAERLRAGPGGLELHRRTGTPLHPMSPLPKLVWFREHEPGLFAAVSRWVGIKEYVLADLVGELAVDHSVASATGLLESATLDWSGDALEVAGISREQLPALVPTTHVFDRLRPDAAERLGVDAATPIVIGASDGPLANLGVGAVTPGVAACSIGTSGALRVMVEKPGVDPLGRVFCYALTRDRWVVGGAINNGGVVLQWAGDALAPDLEDDATELLLHEAGRVPAGSGGLLMLPYLLSERAPHWSSLPRGAYVGLTRAHRREHLVRAALEGVCLQLALVLQSMRAAGNEVREVRATGGFARSRLWRQLLTDALDLPVGFPAGHEGSSFGAALLGMQALGMVDSIDLAASLVRIEQTLTPDPRTAGTYRELLAVFGALYDALVPTYTALRRLSPHLPMEV
jgi:gluconokinase